MAKVDEMPPLQAKLLPYSGLEIRDRFVGAMGEKEGPPGSF